MRYIKGHPEQSYGKDVNRFAKCKICGHINEVSKRPPGGQGEGYKIVKANIYNGNPPNVEFISNCNPKEDLMIDLNLPFKKSIYEEIAVSGCALCGSKNYL